MHSMLKSSALSLAVSAFVLMGATSPVQAAGKKPISDAATIEFELAEAKYEARRTGVGVDFEITDAKGARHVFQHSGNTLVVNSTDTTTPGLFRTTTFDLQRLGAGAPVDASFDVQLDAALGSLSYAVGAKKGNGCMIEYAALVVAGALVVSTCAAGPNPLCLGSILTYLGALSAVEACESQAPVE